MRSKLTRRIPAFALVASITWSGATTMAQDNQSISIPAQTLSSAVVELSNQTGMQIVAPSRLVEGKGTRAVSGVMTPAEALRQLLSGSGLGVEMTGINSAVVTQLSSVSEVGNVEDAGLTDDELIADEIVVQGELQSRTLQDTQTSVAVITGAELERRADNSIFDVFERTAGVSLGSNSENVVIRGVPQGGIGGGAPVITTTIDGAAVDAGRFSFNALQSTWDLEQIEVLRGPQSTQTGRNALAGAIVIRSADPVHELQMKARAEVGNGDTLEGAFAVNVPLIEDTLALRVSVDRRQTDGFVTNTTLGGEDVDDRADTTLRTSVLFEPTDSFSAVFKYTRIESDSSANGPSIQQAQFPDSRISVASFPEREIATFNAGNLRLSYDINDAFSIETETTFSKSNTLTNTDFDFTAAPIGVFVNDQDVEGIEQEVKLFYETDGISAVLGGFFGKEETKFRSDSQVPATLLNPLAPPTLTLVTVQESESKSTNYAVFGEAEIEVLPDLTFIAGARYDRQTNEDSQATTITPPLIPPSVGAGKATFDAFLPKAGLAYDLTEDVTIGATAQRAYRAGGVSISRVTGNQQDFDPEFAWTYELTLRSQWWDDRLTVNANAFYTDWQDQQITIPNPLNPLDAFTENAGSSRLFGGEIDITVTPTDDLSLFASFGYANTEFQDFVLNGVQQAGNEFPFASKYTAAFGGTYFFYEDAYFSADASYQSSAFSDVQNTPGLKLDGRFLANAQLGYEAENWSVSAYVANLFDKDYVTNAPSAAFGAVNVITAGDPRTFGIIGQVNF